MLPVVALIAILGANNVHGERHDPEVVAARTDRPPIIDGNLTSGRYLEIDFGGTFKGSAVVDNAEIAGTFEGELRVHNRLAIHASGLVIGRVFYGQLEVERGGRLNGHAEHDGGNREADLQPVGDESPEITFSTPAAGSETD